MFVLPKTVVVGPDCGTLTTIGLLELQVNGMPVKVIPSVSVTVAFKVVELFALTRNELSPLPKALMEIDCTGQVVNCTGELLTPPELAKNELTPGVFAVAIC